MNMRTNGNFDRTECLRRRTFGGDYRTFRRRNRTLGGGGGIHRTMGRGPRALCIESGTLRGPARAFRGNAGTLGLSCRTVRQFLGTFRRFLGIIRGSRAIGGRVGGAFRVRHWTLSVPFRADGVPARTFRFHTGHGANGGYARAFGFLFRATCRFSRTMGRVIIWAFGIAFGTNRLLSWTLRRFARTVGRRGVFRAFGRRGRTFRGNFRAIGRPRGAYRFIDGTAGLFLGTFG